MRYSDIPDNSEFLISEDRKNLLLHGEMTIGIV
jgi:hypothetical protein